MRKGCLSNLGSLNLWNWKRKSNREEEENKRVTEEICGNVDKSHVHDSSAANNNSSFREKEVIAAKGMADENRSLALDQNSRVVNGSKDDKLDEKIPAEHGLENVHVNRTQTEQDLAQHQAKATRGYKGVAVPKSGDSSNESASGDSLTTTLERKRPHNELNKLKTLVLRSVRSIGKDRQANAKELNKVKTFDLRGVKSMLKGREANAKELNKAKSGGTRGIEFGKKGREETANEFHKTFESRGSLRFGEKGREKTGNEFHKVKTFDLRGVNSSGKERQPTSWLELSIK